MKISEHVYGVILMSKSEKILNLTRNKTKQLCLTLNDELIELFKKACDDNKIKATQLFELWMIKYLEKNNLL